MTRLARWMIIATCALGATGCCNSFCDRLQDGWLWTRPKRDFYFRGPPPPRTTPPGPTTPAALPPPPGVM